MVLVPMVCPIPTAKMDLDILQLLTILARAGQIKSQKEKRKRKVKKQRNLCFVATEIVPGTPQISYDSQQTTFSAATEP